MGDFLSKLFVDVEQIPHDGFGFVQVLFLGAAYLYVLLIGANMIGDGSELLMLIPSIAGVVGSVVLPVLGAVPDGAIVLFSGLGPREKAETQVSVGVGALAGSTIMLLTVPWFLSVLGGRVPLAGGEPQYGKKRLALSPGRQAPAGCGGLLLSQGVSADSSIRTNAAVMLVTCLLCYMVVEIPALAYMHDDKAASDIGPFAWAGVVVCGALFVGYIGLQYYLASASSGVKTTLDQRIVDTMIKTLLQGRLDLRSLSGAFGDMPALALDADARTPALSGASEEWQKKLHAVLRPVFNRFDTDGNGSLSRVEMYGMLEAVGYHVSQAEFDELFASTDADNSGNIDFREFSTWISPKLLTAAGASGGGVLADHGGDEAAGAAEVSASADADGEEEDDDDDAEEVPEDIRELHLTPEQQRRRVLRRAIWQMGVGTLLVLLFSDPMVDVLDALGNNYLHVPPFFVAFLLGPVASNASEMVASYNYAQKKTRKSISVSFSQLLGAACMNNTFCLLIFYGLIAARGFKWVYHAEVMGIVLVEVIMALVASRNVHTVLSGALVLSLLPLSLVVVVVLKATVFNGVES